MKSLDAYKILKALRNREVAKTLIGIETYNATAIDRMSNHYARILAGKLKIARAGDSDAHVANMIGLGATKFKGHTAHDLLKALKERKTSVVKQKELSPAHILGSWATHYILSAVTTRLGLAAW